MINDACIRAVVVGGLFCVGPYARSADFVRLGEFTDGVFLSGATAVSANGTFVAAFRTPPGEDAMSPYQWTAPDQRVFLGQPPGRFSLANAVTDDGQVVVGTHRIERSDIYEQAFVWEPSSGMVPLSGLPQGARHTQANDITPDGTVIVGRTSIGITGAFDSEAFRMNIGGQAIGLGDLPGGLDHRDRKSVV